jgi:hypothetical protein
MALFWRGFMVIQLNFQLKNPQKKIRFWSWVWIFFLGVLSFPFKSKPKNSIFLGFEPLVQ